MAEDKKTPGAQMRISADEVSIIRNTFGGNEELLKLMRKIFLPELDSNAPLGQNIDLWMTVKIDELTNEQAIVNLKARNTVISHIEMQLQVLSHLANTESPSPEEQLMRLKKDSTK